VVIFYFLLLSGIGASATGTLYLTIAYCPTDFSSEGAIVSVNPQTGAWNIEGTFKWPGQVITGCAADYDPIVTTDAATGTVFLEFTEDLPPTIVGVDVQAAKVSTTVNPKNAFFTGFENMQYLPSGSSFLGFSGNVATTGFCSDGCFQLNEVALSGKVTNYADLPFKAMMDDSHYYDDSSNTYWVQASYDLREESEWCAPNNADLCLLSVDGLTGDLLSAKWTNWTVYKFGPQQTDGNFLTWMYGFESLCKHPYDDFLFAYVNLADASATPIACIEKNVTVHEDEWISSFSLDGTLFATGSGDAETGVPQVLVFKAKTGATLLNTALPGLAAALKTIDGIFMIWSVDFL